MRYVLTCALALVVVVAVLWLVLGSVIYQGQRIWLSVPLLDYDTFKNRPGNLSEGQAKKVQDLLVAAPVAVEYRDGRDMIYALSALKFPGFGSSLLHGEAPEGGKLILYCIEMPLTDKDRCLLFREAADGRLIRVDDVIAEPFIAAVELVDDRPVYRNRNGEAVTVEPKLLLGVD